MKIQFNNTTYKTWLTKGGVHPKNIEDKTVSCSVNATLFISDNEEINIEVKATAKLLNDRVFFYYNALSFTVIDKFLYSQVLEAFTTGSKLGEFKILSGKITSQSTPKLHKSAVKIGECLSYYRGAKDSIIGRSEKNDCTVVAIALNIDYTEAHKIAKFELRRRNKQGAMMRSHCFSHKSIGGYKVSLVNENFTTVGKFVLTNQNNDDIFFRLYSSTRASRQKWKII